MVSFIKTTQFRSTFSPLLKVFYISHALQSPLCPSPPHTHTYFLSTTFSSSEIGKFKAGQSGKGLNEFTGEYDPNKAYVGRGKDT